jgi:oligoendopeptidase F
MADPARGALVSRLGEKAAGLETQLLFFGLEWAAIEDEPAATTLADPALDQWRHWLASQRVFRPYVLTEPEEKILTEKAVSGVTAWSRLFEEVLGAMRVDLPGADEPVSLETAMAMKCDSFMKAMECLRRTTEILTTSGGTTS